MGYVSTSTANPLGWRAFNAQLTQPVVPSHGFRLNGLAGVEENRLRGYYPANYFVPTPMNITMRPQANIYDACPDGTSARDLSGLGDHINNIQWLRPGGWRTRDDDFSPIPRIYRPPEGLPLSHYGLGWDVNYGLPPVRPEPIIRRAPRGGESWWQWLFGRPRFSGGAIGTNPADPRGFYFPRTPAQPLQFGATPGLVWSPDPGDPSGTYYPRVPTPVVPAWLRARAADWTGADSDHLLPHVAIAKALAPGSPGMAGLGDHLALLSAVSIAGRTAAAPRPVAVSPRPVTTPAPKPVTVAPVGGRTFPTPVGPARLTPPVVISGGPQSPSGYPLRGTPGTPGAPVVNPGTPATVPPGVTVIGNGMCVVQSSPETGSDVSTVPCAGVPGYSAGTAPSVTYPGQPGYPYPPAGYPPTYPGAVAPGTVSAGLTAAIQNYAAAQSLISSGGTLTAGQLAQFTPAQQAALVNQMNAYGSGSLTSAVAAANAGQPLTAAQQAALTAAGYSGGGGASAAPAAASGGSSSDAADVLGWLSQSSLITGVPNWVIAGGGGLLVLWVMNRGKK